MAATVPGLRGPFSYRQQTSLAAFAEYLDHTVSQVELVEIEPRQLRQPQPGGIEQLQNRLVPTCQKVIFNPAFKQLQGAVGVEGFRQAAFAFRRRKTIGRIVVAQTFAVQVMIEPANGRQQSRQAAGRLALGVQTGNQAAQALDVQRRPAADVLFDAPAQHFIEVAAVGR